VIGTIEALGVFLLAVVPGFLALRIVLSKEGHGTSERLDASPS
jgi:hypothetical protein